MKAKFDDKEITLSKGFVDAIKNLMREEILMMRKVYSDSPECWQIGVCTIENLASSNGLSFSYGGNDDKSWLKKEGTIFVSVE